MKWCNKCKKEKPENSFHNLFRRGVIRPQSCCIECRKEWVKNNKEKINSAARKWHWKNRERSNARAKNYWKRKMERTPKWLTVGYRIELKWAKQIAIQRTKETGIKYEVDHIIPLYGDIASGLNVPWNIQVIEASKNKAKGRKVCPML